MTPMSVIVPSVPGVQPTTILPGSTTSTTPVAVMTAPSTGAATTTPATATTVPTTTLLDSTTNTTPAAVTTAPTIAATTTTPAIATTLPPTTVPQIPGALPFGPFEPLREDLGRRFTGAFLLISPNSAMAELDNARAAGAGIALNLVGSRKYYANANGTFNLDMWKARVDRFAALDLEQFVVDETILVHYLIDESKSRSRWGGEVIPNDVLDEMARYSKQYWPTMPTAVRASPSKLARHAAGYDAPWPEWEWSYLDTAWAQYSARKGPIALYAAEQRDEARAQGLGLVVGLNIFTGGDGSSGIAGPGAYSDSFAMSSEELVEYGSTLISGTNACAFIMWRYASGAYENYVYWGRPEIDSAMAQLAGLASRQQAASCSRR